METVILNSNSKKDLQLLIEIAKKIGIKAKYISKVDAEDAGLLSAMKKGKKGKHVDTDTFIEKLRK